MGVDPYLQMTKQQLLAEMDKIEAEMLTFLASETFDSEAQTEAPWGKLKAIDLLHAMRAHDILHIGWNLALMDHLGMQRFQSLIDCWG